MKVSVRTSKKNTKVLTPEQKEALELEAKTIVDEFAANLKQGVPTADERNQVLLQKHFDWAKKSITKNKVEYLNMVKRYSTEQANIKALNSIAVGLPAYMKAVALTYISKIN